MRALTVQQPWAWAIVHGGKDVENRTQAWSYRGPIAIHAGVRVSQRGIDHELLRPEWACPGPRGYVHVAEGRAEISYPDRTATQAPNRLAAVLPLGAIIGVVDLVDVHGAEHAPGQGMVCCDSEWAETSYAEYAAGDDSARVRRDVVHLVLENPRPLEVPIPCKGRLGLWTPPAEVLDQLEAVLA